MRRLEGKTAVVTGASRGAGRAIALALGEEGATVYATGRSGRDGSRTEDLPGTVEETAEAVTAAGGEGIAVVCDHGVESQVADLFARVARERQGLDLLVNNAWGGYERYDPARFSASFWEQEPRHWEGMFERGVRFHLTAGRLAAPMMIARHRGLIVGTTFWDREKYLGNLYYDVAKAAIARLAWGMAQELRGHGVGALALAPGFMRTERVMAAHAQHPFDLGRTESPAYLGRAVAALAADPDVLRLSGKVLYVGDLAREYGFTDVDGRQPEPFRIPEG